MEGSAVRLALWRGLRAVESWFDAAFGQRANPWRHLGALSFFLFWIIAVTGFYLFAVFDTSAAGAYASVEYLTRQQWYLGGVVRSLHRYASDAFVVTVLLHLAREFLSGRYRGFRWFSWVTGVPLLWLLYASGIGGYWLVWDQLAQFSLTATTEWLDWINIFGETLTRNFLMASAVSDRFFSLLIFLHIGIPLLLLLGMWVHIQRVSRPGTSPPRVLAWGTGLMLLVLSLAKPALSHAPADLAGGPGELGLDWFYMAIHPIMYGSSAGTLWALVGIATLVLALLPWMFRGAPVQVARVDLANCNGCGRCFADCPYAAVVMQPRTDGKPLLRQATVLADLCAGCGICAGACPSSTPFRSVSDLVTGIDMPQLPVAHLREELERGIAQLAGPGKIAVFGCACGADLGRLSGPETLALPLLCTGMLPPSFVEYAVRAGADGVLITGCRDGDCAYRLGNRWTEERLAREREPHLRGTVARERVRVFWAGESDLAALKEELARFRSALRALEERSAPHGHAPKRTLTRATR